MHIKATNQKDTYELEKTIKQSKNEKTNTKTDK